MKLFRSFPAKMFLRASKCPTDMSVVRWSSVTAIQPKSPLDIFEEIHFKLNSASDAANLNDMAK
jgi:hypothetical protein